jgi:hypothetical protein
MDLSSIPKQYGGELEWQWGDMPNLDEPAQELLQGLEQEPAEGKTKKELIKGPVLFKGDKVEVLGTVDGKERRSTILVPQKDQTTTTENSELAKEESTETPANGDAEKPVENVTVNVEETQTTTATA